MTQYEEYLKLFDVTPDDLQDLLRIALSKGGEYADLYFEDSISNNIILLDSQVNSTGHHIDFGVGIRVVFGERTGYAYSETTEIAAMEKAAKAATMIASEGSDIISCNSDINVLKSKKHYFPTREQTERDTENKIRLLYEFDDIAKQADKRVKKVMARISDSVSRILFINSLGESFTDERPMTTFAANCVMEDNGRTESGGCSRSFRKDIEMLNSNLIKEVSKEMLDKTSFLFGAKQPKGGEMSVIMSAGASGILLHEAMGHAFEADFNRKGISIFSNKMGSRICDKNINIVDDGTLEYNRGAVNFDDEGVPGQKTYMVKDGILNSYLHDRISAKYYGVKPTGNGRRESFRYIPIPRMRLTYMENGNMDESELILSVKKGIYCENFTNGQVNIGAGDFTFFVKSGYLIENGHLTMPIKDTNIIGNGPQALADITAVANNLKIDNSKWVCGKEQYCPVSCGMPSVLVKSLTVGGNF